MTVAAVITLVGVATALPTLSSQTVAAQDATSKIDEGVKAVGGNNNTVKLEDQIKNITNVLLFVLGAIAVIVIIIGGIRYVTSNGDSTQTKAAKDTILYAVIGLIVAIVAYAIVNWVISAFTK